MLSSIALLGFVAEIVLSGVEMTANEEAGHSGLF
jgi:hypothetical protein